MSADDHRLYGMSVRELETARATAYVHGRVDERGNTESRAFETERFVPYWLAALAECARRTDGRYCDVGDVYDAWWDEQYGEEW